MKKCVGIIVGSLRENSYNRKIAHTVMDLDAKIEFKFIEISNLPLFNEDLEADGGPEAVQMFKNAIEYVEGVLIVSPEYNSGIPGVLKNALDWASRPAKKSVLLNKPVGIIGATPGGMGTAFSQMQIRQVLEAMRVPILPFSKVLISRVHEKIDLDSERVTDERTIKHLQQYMNELSSWIDAYKK